MLYNKNFLYSFQMLSLINIFLLLYFSASLAKVTYCKAIYPSKSMFEIFFFLVNLENTYGPYCNPNNKFTPDAGIVRYAGFINKIILFLISSFICLSRTPWMGKCVLNLQSCCLPVFQNGSLMPNLSISTKFYVHLLMQPLCLTENVTIKAGSGELVINPKHKFPFLINKSSR
jgi:hypothetical protein